MDNLSKKERSKRMALIRSKDTKPELIVRRVVQQLGLRFRLHLRDLPGVPDLVLVSRKKAIFVHGCFWHQHAKCAIANRPKSRRSYWDAKFRRNVARDRMNERLLKNDGWDVLTIWECETKDVELLAKRISGQLRARDGAKRRKRGRL